MTSSSDHVALSLSDLKKLFYRLLPQLKTSCCVGACIGFVFFLMREPRFSAQATFKQASSASPSGFSLKDLFQGMGTQSGQEVGLKSMMTSRIVLRDAIEELGLQVQESRSFAMTQLLSRVWENIGLEIGSKLPEVDRFVFHKVRYDQEKTEVLFLKVLDDGSFKLFDKRKNELGRWRLNEPISLSFFSGCLTKIPQHVRAQRLYRLNLIPWIDVLNPIRKRFSVKSIKSESSIYGLTFVDRDRYLAADFLNQVMTSCRKRMHCENEEIASAQVVYLEKRQEELSQKWDGALQEHVAYLKNNLKEGGYLSFAQELNSLQEPQNTLASRLLAIDFELQKLTSNHEQEKKVDRQSGFLDHTSSWLHITPVNQERGLLAEQHRKEIDKKLLHLDMEQQTLESGMAQEISLLSQQQQAAAERLAQLESNPERSMLYDPKSLTAIWGKQVADQKLVLGGLPQEKEQLKAYIDQVTHKINILQDNIAVHQTTEQEFAGLTLETAQRLYLDHNSQRDSLQVQLKQLIHLAEQLYQPEFELSSMTTILTDPITQNLLFQAGETAVRLQDGSNRSVREQERLKETLRTQKSFLAEHLLQIIELTKLRVKLAEDKIRSLSITTIDLLKREKQLVQQQLDQISHQMESLPEKWRRENLLLLKKELGTKVIEGMTQLMESKTIDRHLYHVGSRPLDVAFPPPSPKNPYLLLAALIGGFLGVCGSYSFSLCRFLMKGIPISHESLSFLGFNSSGSLSADSHLPIDQLPHSDLETMRRLAQFLLNLDRKGICSVIIGGKHPNFASTFAELLAMQHRRVLVIHYIFDQPVHSGDVPGLWQYLQGNVSDCPIRQNLSHDFVPSGGTSRHAVEILGHPKLIAFLASAKERYDFILFYSNAQPTDVEGQALLKLADAAIVATRDETRDDLIPYQTWSLAQEKRDVTFVYLT